MGLIGILALMVLALFVVLIKFVADGIRDKHWKKVIASIVVFIAVLLLLYFGLLQFITSM